MHAIPFRIKRAFRTSVEILLDFARDFELTPARYELLFIVREHKLTWLSEVRRMLGVTAATVSRMLKSLVARGMVTVSVPAKDRRQRAIHLTPKGEDCMRRALACLRDSGGIDFVVESMFGPPADDRTPRMLKFHRCVDEVRRACGDTSTDPDPWDPCDWESHDDDEEHIEYYEGLMELEFVQPEDLGPEVIPISFADPPPAPPA